MMRQTAGSSSITYQKSKIMLQP